VGEAVLQGNLSAFRLPEVLTFLSTTRKSGRLTIANDGKEAYLFFEDGALVYAGSNQERFRLGAILLRKKKMTRAQSERIDALMAGDGGRFGQHAVKEGVLTEAQLRDFLKVQVSEIVYDCFVWDGGTFAFTDDSAQIPQHAVTISVDLANLIMEGARRIEEWEHCLKLLPDKSIVYRVVVTPRDEKITLTADEWQILFLINAQRTLEDLCHDADEEPFHVYRVMYGLHANKLIEPVPPLDDHDDTHSPNTTAPMPTASGDATFRQGSPAFSGESTVHEMEDDTSLLVSSEAKLSYADVVRPTIAQLTVESPESGTRVIPLTEPEYLIGRHRDNTIQLNDPGVSGFHARLYLGAQGYIVEDLKSRNGIWVNGARVYHATLAHGDRLHIGQTDLLFEVLFARTQGSSAQV
jgi:hypothetical protein